MAPTPTGPIPGDVPLLVIGDWGAGTESQSQVAEEMRARAALEQDIVIVTTGDNLYSDNAAALTEPYDWARELGVPFLVTWGNHDVESRRRIEIVNQVFRDPPRWRVVEWGQLDLIILDSTQIDSASQIEFLSAHMATSGRPAVVIYHHPAYNCGLHGPDQQVRNTWLPLFDNDVVLVLNGHDHNYQRFQADNLTHIVTGGGGRFLHYPDSCPKSHPTALASEATHHFLMISQQDGLRVEVIAADGLLIDSLSIALP